ncbi:hypothetical protein I4U23_030067 [Adineta vaga]|nr:hypothetical protein I4U23_030067 [Adineta vaga]
MLTYASKPSEDDIMKSITNEERERMKEFEKIRSSTFNCFFENPPRVTGEPSIVLDDFLFLGDMGHGKNKKILEKLQIRHILNVCDWDTNKIIRDNFNVIHISLLDESQTNIKQHFERTNELLHGFYEKKERCLVHCAAGISRSATIVLAYLLKYHHNTLKEAYTYLVAKRPLICPNEGFLLQLIHYEKDLIQSREIQPTSETKFLMKENNPIETLNEFEDKHNTDE